MESKAFPVTIRKLEHYLSNSIAENKALRDLSWWAFTTSGVIRNVVDYMVALPTLDRIIFSKDRVNGEKPDSYEHNRSVFSYTLEKIKDKEFVRDSVLKNCNDGVSFYYFINAPKPVEERYVNPMTVTSLTQINEKSDINCSLFALPVDYCKIVSIRNNSY